jgi:hypothetical protein
MDTRTALIIAAAALGLPAAAHAQTPPPPPTPDQVKACVQQMDLAKQWSFDWKTVAVGQARHPKNAYERAGLRGEEDFGYPVHVTYVFDHAYTIDADYWMTHDAQNNWWIAAICTPPRR